MILDEFLAVASDEILQALESSGANLRSIVFSLLETKSVRAIAQYGASSEVDLEVCLKSFDASDEGLVGRLLAASVQCATSLGYESVSANLFLRSISHGNQDGRLDDLVQCLASIRLAPIILDGPREGGSYSYKGLGFGTDLNLKMLDVQDEPLRGRVDELERVQKILLAQRSVVLTGKPGVGKSALVEGLAWCVVHRPHRLIEELRSTRLIAVQASDLIADSSRQGELEERLKKFTSHLLNTKNLIVFIDEIHSLFSGNERTGRVIVDSLKPVLARGTVQVIGASTDSEFQQYFQSDRALRERFRRVVLLEPGVEETICLISAMGDSILPARVRDRGATLGDGDGVGIREAVVLSSKHYLGSSRPRKPIDILKEAAAEKAFKLAKGEEVSAEVGIDDVREVVASDLNIHKSILASESFDQVAYLRKIIEERCPSQESVASTIANSVSPALTGLADSSLPLACLAFIGNTQVVASICALLASTICGSEDAVYRIDFPTLEGESAVFQLRGAPHGYRDSGSGGNIFGAVGVDGRPHVIAFENVGQGKLPVIQSNVEALLISMLSGAARSGLNEETNFSKCIFIFSSTDSETLIQFLGTRLSSLLDTLIVLNENSIDAPNEDLRTLIEGRLQQTNVSSELQLRLLDEANWHTIAKNSSAIGLRRALNKYIREQISEISESKSN